MILLDLLYLIPYIALGAAFSLAYIKSNNIFTSYLIHLFHNSMTVLLVILALGFMIYKKKNL